jgi:hypothetical protein
LIAVPGRWCLTVLKAGRAGGGCGIVNFVIAKLIVAERNDK